MQIWISPFSLAMQYIHSCNDGPDKPMLFYPQSMQSLPERTLMPYKPLSDDKNYKQTGCMLSVLNAKVLQQSMGQWVNILPSRQEYCLLTWIHQQIRAYYQEHATCAFLN